MLETIDENEILILECDQKKALIGPPIDKAELELNCLNLIQNELIVRKCLDLITAPI